MAQASVRFSEPEDIEWILPQCSRTELRTLEEMYDDSPESLLRVAIYSDKRPYSGLIDGKVVCIFGAYSSTLLSEEVYIWLLGSRALRQYPMLFIRHCKPILEWLTKDYAIVKTCVDERNPQAKRLAKFLKFQTVSNKNWNASVELRRH